MLWYVIQTYTGQEEKLVGMVKKMIPRQMYGKCFVAYFEQLRRRQQKNQIHIERVFPGYVFITSEAPDELFLRLKAIPAMTRLLADGDYFFLSLDQDEAAVLEQILDSDHVIRLSYAATDGKDHVSYLSGPLAACRSRLIRYQFRQRYAVIGLRLAGEQKEVRLGILLKDDISRELTYGKVEAPISLPEVYRIASCKAENGADSTPEKGEIQDKRAEFAPGDRIVVISGAFAGMPAMVYENRKHTVKIGVHFFDRDMTVEVPAESIRKQELAGSCQ